MNPFRTPSLKKRRAPGAQQMREALDCTEIRGRRSSPFPKETAAASNNFRENAGPSFGRQRSSDRRQGSRSKAPVAGGRAGSLPTDSAARRAVERPRLPLKKRSPKPEQQPRRGAKQAAQTAGSQKPTPGRWTKKTGRSGKRSIPRMEKQWREAERRFGLA